MHSFRYLTLRIHNTVLKWQVTMVDVQNFPTVIAGIYASKDGINWMIRMDVLSCYDAKAGSDK